MPTVVVGAGILGLAVARELQRVRPADPVTVLDKESSVAAHQTGHNSGVVHAGVYYPPGSLKARLCRRGVDLLRDYTSGRGIAFDEVGKVVVAVDAVDEQRLTEVRRRALANGVPGVTMLGPAGLRDVEPYVRGRAALHSPRTAITALLIGLGTAVLAKAVSSLLLTAGGRSALEATLGPVPAGEPGSLEHTLTTGSYGITPPDSWWWLATAGPHSATPFDLLHTAGLAAAVLGVCSLAAIVLGERAWLLAPLSAPGSMPLSVYTGHVVFLEISRLAPIRSLVELMIHVGLAVIFALLWRGFASPRGPLEWPVSSAVRAVQRRVLGDSRPTPGDTRDPVR